MNKLTLYLGIPATLAMMAVSMGCNWLYLSGFGKTAAVFALLSAASIAIDVMKAVAPFWMSAAWTARQPVRWLLALTVFALCTTISLTSAIGLLAQLHATSTGGQDALNARYRALTGGVEDLRTQLGLVTKARARSVVEGSIAAMQADPHWGIAKGCANDLAPTFCKKYLLLQTELKEAQEAERLRAALATSEGQLGELRKQGAGQVSDARGALFAKLIGVSADQVNFAIELCFALLVEMVATFGFFLAIVPAHGCGSTSQSETLAALASDDRPPHRLGAIQVIGKPGRRVEFPDHAATQTT